MRIAVQQSVATMTPRKREPVSIDNSAEPVLIGAFAKTRGVAGHIYVHLYHAEPETFLGYKSVLVNMNGRRVPLTVVESEIIGGRVVTRIEGYDTPELSAQLTNREIYIDLEQLPDLPRGRNYVKDLVGCTVVDTGGTERGLIMDVLNYPANDVFVIRTSSGADILFPAVDVFVERVDTSSKIVVVRPPAGLFD